MNMNSELLEKLRVRGELWKASEIPMDNATVPCRRGLKKVFPQGWPTGTLMEILSPSPGFGEVSLFMSLAAELTHSGREVAWVSEGGTINAPALVSAGVNLEHFLWADSESTHQSLCIARELLSSGDVPLVLILSEIQDFLSLRRLSLAAREGKSLGVLLSRSASRAELSPCQLRLEFPVSPRRSHQLFVLKARGIPSGTVIDLDG